MKNILFLLVMLAFVYRVTGQNTDKPAPADPQRMELVRDEVHARLMLRRHEKGEVSLSPEELQRYRDIIAKASERRAKEDGTRSTNADKSKTKDIIVRDMPLGALVPGLEKKYGWKIEISERARNQKVTFEITKTGSKEEFASQLKAELSKAGVSMVSDGNRVIFGAMSDKIPEKTANQTSEPTIMSVTPPAAQEPRQP